MKSTKVWMVAALVLITAAVLTMPVAARVGYDTIENADTIFWYEKDLVLPAGTAFLVHYTDEIGPGNAINDRIVIDDPADFDVAESAFQDTYYGRDAADVELAFSVTIKKPTITLDIVNGDTLVDKLNDKTITKGTPVAFRIRSNVPAGFDNVDVTDTAYVELRFTTPEKGQTRLFGGQTYNPTYLIDQDFYTTDEQFDVSLTDDVQSGVWQVRAQWVAPNVDTGVCALGFCDFYGEGVDSNTVSFTISSGKVSLATNKDEVVRDAGFTLTINGRGSTHYWLYIEDAAVDCDEYPWMVGAQPGVTAVAADVDLDDDYADDEVVIDDVVDECDDNPDSTYIFKADVLTTAAGTRAVEFDTNAFTDDRSFTMTVVEAPDGDPAIHDSVTVKVSKGSITIDAEGDKVYYMGEEVKLMGENTDSEETFLFMVGPNLCECGSRLDNPSNWLQGDGCPDDFEPFFVVVDVEEDNTWEYDWDTADLGLDAGTYTVYAVSTDELDGELTDKCNLADAIYDQITVTLRKPFLTAELSSPRVAKGDELLIKGTAEGNPDNVAVWIFGTNVFRDDDANVEDDQTYEYTIERGDTDNWDAGQFFVVVQHPMYNGQLDVYRDGDFVYNEIKDIDEFKIAGQGRLMGSDAAEALIQVLNEPNIDDTYTKLYFLLEEAWINIDAVSDKYIGDKFTLGGTTNLAVDDTFTVTVTSASFKPTEKTQSGEFSGVAGSSKVVKGTGVDNTWSFEVDTKNFKPDQYIVSVECVETGTTSSTTFFVSEVPPTTVPTTAPPTTVPLTTAVTTVPPTTVPPTTTPGFGAVIALIGLGAVAVLVLRRH